MAEQSPQCDFLRCGEFVVGYFQLVNFTFTLSSSERTPCSTSLSAPTAATGLLIEPAWKSVLVVTAAPPAATTPYARALICPS